MSLESMGVGRAEILSSMTMALQEGEGNPAYTSMTTFMVNPLDDTVCDIKIVLRHAFNTAGYDPKFTSGRYQPDLLKLGFAILRFSKRRLRTLGVRGYDPQELLDEHVVFCPDGRRKANLLSPEAIFETIPLGQAARSERVYQAFVRDQSLVGQAKERAAGKCEKCKTYAFKNLAGEWYLEVHHKVWLSEGGSDHIDNLVALCPNCHAEEHFGKRLYK